MTEQGLPLQYGFVAVKDTGSDVEGLNGKTVAATNTGADGKYVIPNVSVGTYAVCAHLGDFALQDRDSVHVSEQ